MRKPFLSIIIPAHNSAPTLSPLLDSIFASKFSDFEIILIDDGSTDQTKEVSKNYKIRYFFIENTGPGGARNFGAKKAQSDILVFFDSDVELFPNTLEEIKKAFKNKKTVAITGIWDKKQKRRDLFPRYKALRDWSYWFNEDMGRDYSRIFSPRVAAIRKKIFREFGGFVDCKRGVNALEEFDLSYRLTKKYTIEFTPEVKVHHEFDGAREMLMKFFARSFEYTKVFLRHREFSRNGYTPSETLAGATAIFILASLFLGFWAPFAWFVLIFLLLVHLYLERKFLIFAFQEEGFIFAIKSVFAGFIVYLVVYAAASFALLHSIFLFLKKKLWTERKKV